MPVGRVRIDNMATTAQELIVALRSEGGEQTQQQINQVGDSVKEVEGDVDKTSGKLAAFANKIKGVMKAVIAGVAVAVGGLATQIPVLGGLLEGATAVVSALAFQLDKRLRPAITPLINDFYALSDAIFEGDWQRVRGIFQGFINSLRSIDLSKVVGDLVNTLSGLNIGGFLNQFQKISAGFFANIFNELAELDIRKLLQDLYDRIGTIVEKIEWGENMRPLIAAIGNFIASTDWLGIAADLIKALGNAVRVFFKEVDWGEWYDFIAEGVSTWADNTDFSAVAKDILTGIAKAMGDLGGFFGDIISSIVEDVVIDPIKEKIEMKIEEELNVDVNLGEGERGELDNIKPSNSQIRGSRNDTQIDGRSITESTGRYRRDATNRRGI